MSGIRYRAAESAIPGGRPVARSAAAEYRKCLMNTESTQSVLAPPRQAPPVVRSNPVARRLIALTIWLGCTAVLTVAFLVTPAEAGLGTHQQLNLPACGWIVTANLPCFTCGMTTSFAHAVRGNLLSSIVAQPAGFLLALGTAMTMFVSLHVLITGSNLAGFFLRLWSPRLLWLVGIVFLGAWVFKIVMYKEYFG